MLNRKLEQTYLATIKVLILGILLGLSSQYVLGQTLNLQTLSSPIVNLENYLSIYIDSSGNELIDDIKVKSFSKNSSVQKNVLNFGMSKNAYWCKLDITNTNEDQYLKLHEPTIDEIDVICINDSQTLSKSTSGASLIFNKREVKVTNYLFQLPKGTYTCYIRIKSNFNLQVPITIGSLKNLAEEQHSNDFLLALYFGLMLIMIIYNFFIYLSTRDKEYLFYILYIFFVTLFYASLKGISFEYLWPNTPYYNFLIPSFASIINVFGSIFIILLLHTRNHLPKLTKGIYGFIGVFVICILINLFGFYELSSKISQPFTAILSIYLIIVGIQSIKKGVKVAKFFLLAWTLFLISVVIFILKLNGVLPFNTFTNNSVLYGSALEAILLSFALADKINTYKKEKELEQYAKLEAMEENKRIILNQNQMLETKVQEKTKELTESNTGLSKALADLKNTQVSLVESEKMASLGQLTAGVAHEINNPINFVSSNVKPLIRDFDDINKFISNLLDKANKKEEITSDLVKQLHSDLDIEYTQKEISDLLVGIQEGANRTAEIVKGLKNFSRLDESDFKTADIEEGLDSTLILLRSNMRGEIDLEKDYAKIPAIDCYAGKLNQVFMNLINNSVYAILNNPHKESGKKGIIKLSTVNEPNWVKIIIEDTGMGMEEETINKLFNPFFTTKPVGEGTGLGMSITYSIINELHKGNIEVESEIGKGTKVILSLPKMLKK